MKTLAMTVICGILSMVARASIAAEFPDVRDESFTEANGSRVLKLSIAVEASAATIWQLLSSADGWRSWAVPVAWVDFGVGGVIETSYDATAVRGRPGNIRNAIVAYVPQELLVIRNIQAPPNFENAEDFAKTITVIRVRSVSAGRSSVELDGVGFLPSPAFDSLLKKFKFGDSWTLEHLKRAAEHGPIDWAAEEKSNPPKQSR
jgi:polyketide cyclase/dehydrase/lipid transport protein